MNLGEGCDCAMYTSEWLTPRCCDACDRRACDMCMGWLWFNCVACKKEDLVCSECYQSTWDTDYYDRHYTCSDCEKNASDLDATQPQQ
jgi:hypothetical protein